MIYVTATDHGNPSLSANVTLMVYVDDVNDEPPVFLNMTVEVPREVTHLRSIFLCYYY